MGMLFKKARRLAEINERLESIKAGLLSALVCPPCWGSPFLSLIRDLDNFQLRTGDGLPAFGIVLLHLAGGQPLELDPEKLLVPCLYWCKVWISCFKMGLLSPLSYENGQLQGLI
ncbi:hypothetical protein NC651_000010 [Populus alba x Populus x berolinensis]|nr:hypothetical protein NC651_000010 [Populus alba x Populus x berolinensis]